MSSRRAPPPQPADARGGEAAAPAAAAAASTASDGMSAAAAAPVAEGRPPAGALLPALCAVAVSAALSLALYSTSHGYNFTFDDHLAVENNADARWGAPWSALVQHDFWGKDLKCGRAASCALALARVVSS